MDNLSQIIDLLSQEYPGAVITLEYKTPLQLLVAAILSAQSTDEKVNQITPVLFNQYKTCTDFASADLKELQHMIKPIGLYRNKAQFIIKPNTGYGGFGIVIGKETDQNTWDDTINRGLQPGGDDAVQEFVEIPVDNFPIMEDGKFIGFEPRNVNVNFWSHAGEFAGSFVRAATGSIINVHQGGGLVPAFWVSPR